MTNFEIVILLLFVLVTAYFTVVMLRQNREIKSLEVKVDTLAKVLAEYEQHLGILQQATKFRVSTRQAR